VDSSEATLARERCEVHADRAAVGLCERCGRTVCIDCAIPFRGAIRCERCAALELGEPAPTAAPSRRRIRLELVALVLLVIAGIATIPPWHRSGTLTTRLSAWTFGLDGWAALACATLAAALVLTLVAVLRRGAAPWVLAAGGILSGLSAISVLVALMRAPEFFSATLAPLVTLAGTAGAAAAVGFRLLRLSRP
jgi:hypothetical protein